MSAFDAWEHFRRSIASAGRRESLETLKSESLMTSTSSTMATAGPARSQGGGMDPTDDDGAHHGLTPEEKRDIESWKMRLKRTEVFGRYYIPERWEAREMKSVAEFLELENPREGPSYLVCSCCV